MANQILDVIIQAHYTIKYAQTLRECNISNQLIKTGTNGLFINYKIPLHF